MNFRILPPIYEIGIKIRFNYRENSSYLGWNQFFAIADFQLERNIRKFGLKICQLFTEWGQEKDKGRVSSKIEKLY